MKKLRLALTGIFVLAVLTVLAILSYTILEPKAYDFMIKHATTERLPFDSEKNIYGHDNVVLVMIEDESIKKYRWPWKRDLNNKVLNYFLEYAKPKVFIHDSVILTSDIDNPQADERYYETLSKFDNLVEGFVFSPHPYKDSEQGSDYDKIFTEKYKIKNIELKAELPYLYKSTLMSPQKYINSVKNAGSVTVMHGFLDGYLSIIFGDETYRTHEYLANYKDNIMPSLSMKAFLVANNNPKIVIEKNQIIFPELNYKIDYIQTPWQAIVPTKFYKMYESGYSHKMYTAVDIMDSYDAIKSGKKPKIDPEVFRDKYVIFGANVSVGNGLNDVINTPMEVRFSGADFQATCVDNIVHKDFLKILPNGLNFMLNILCMLFVYYVIRKFNLIKAINYTLVIIVLTVAIAACCFYHGIVINAITPAVMCAVMMILAYIHRYVLEAETKEKVETAMGKYMSEDVMKRVIQNIDNLGLGGKKAVVTVLFSDIRGFTSMSEKMSAQDVSSLLNEYFSAMEPIVTKYNGIINKFIGDAVMAVFGEPIQNDEHPLNAVKCGVEMLRKVEELNEKWQKEGKPTIRIGVGINTGEVFIGNIGSEKRMEYTVIGDTVNIASRLEGYNKTYKTDILISSRTYEVCSEKIEVNKISDVEIRGKAEKMDIYEVTDIK